MEPIRSVILNTPKGPVRIPTWLGFACGSRNYHLSISGKAPWSHGISEVDSVFKGAPFFGLSWFSADQPVNLAPTPGKWHWFITYPNTPADQWVTQAELDTALSNGKGHPVLARFIPTRFPEGSVIYWPDLNLLLDIQNRDARALKNVQSPGWCWQGRRWDWEGGVLTLRMKFLSPTPGEFVLRFNEDDVAMLRLLDPEYLQTLPVHSIIELYHRLVNYVKSPERGRICAELKPSELTPRPFIDEDRRWDRDTVELSPFGWSYQWEFDIRRLIWESRNDLKSVDVVENGVVKKMPLLVPPQKMMDSGSGENSFYNEGSPFKCAWVGDVVNKWFTVVMGVLTLGAPTLVTLPMTLAKTIVDLASNLESAFRQKEIMRWLEEHMVGYRTALTQAPPAGPVTVETLKQPPADPTGLTERAEGLPAPSVRTNSSGWLIPLLLAGAVALLG